MMRFPELPRGLAAAIVAALCFAPGPGSGPGSAVFVCASPSVHVDMKAAFASPPYLVELLETAAAENASSYFPLLDRIADGAFVDSNSDRQRYDKFIQLLQNDEHLTTPDALSTFNLALALRSSAPRVEAHYQFYRAAVRSTYTDADADAGVCLDWVLQDDKRFCSASLAKGQPYSSPSRDSQFRQLPFDRVTGHGPEAILYADITSPEFGEFHRTLSRMARNGQASYRLRHRPDLRQAREPLPVAGYGVELQLKRTDYIVIDDREAAAEGATRKPHQITTPDVALDDQDEVADLKPLSSSELASLGLGASSFIMQSEAPFETLVKLTQDFPKFSAAVAAHNASKAFAAEHRENRALMVPAGMNVMWINGVQMTERQVDPFNLVDQIRRERRLITSVTSLGLSGKQSVALLGHEAVTAAKSGNEPQRFDWRDQTEGGKVIIWLNNLEKDSRYSQYPSDLMALMQRTYPGQIPPIRKNLFNLIIPLDFSDPDDLAMVIGQIQDFVKRAIPIRFGLVPSTATKAAEGQAKIVYHLIESYGLGCLMTYLNSCQSSPKGPLPEQATFDAAVQSSKIKSEATQLSFAQISESPHLEGRARQAGAWLNRLGAHGTVPSIFINGLPLARDANWLRTMSMKLSGDLQTVQQALFTGSIDQTTSIASIFLKNAATRRNTLIFPDGDDSPSMLDINHIYSTHKELLDMIPVLEADEGSSRDSWAAITVVGDFTDTSGLQLLLSTLEYRRSSPGVRVELVHNPQMSLKSHGFNSVLLQQGSKLLDVENMETLEVLATGEHGASDNTYERALSPFLTSTNMLPGQSFVIFNGRKVGPILPGTQFLVEDFAQLRDVEISSRILPVYNAADALGITAQITGPLVAAKLSSITALSSISDVPEGIFENAPPLRTTVFDKFRSDHTMIEMGDATESTIHIVAVLNPTSEVGQKWAPILKVLSELKGVHLRIFLNPKERLEELPIKRFYRHVLASKPAFDEAGKIRPLDATFKGIPSEALLNLGVDVPPAWLVSAKVAVQDLDNLKMGSIKTDVSATYELEHILIEGHSREGVKTPPRGVQLLLGTDRDPHFGDTIIMSNIGYFQFKANPGIYDIQLKKGRSSEVYDIVSVGAQGYRAVPGDESTEVALMSFQGTTLYPRLSRKPGQEQEDVLEERRTGDDLISRGLKLAGDFAGNLLGGGSQKSLSAREHADINIFSVASGHLYERMLNIMMVSVMKNTKHTVKFWFIEQFLSPSFKEFIPHLAAEYGFKYEMVTYKWPHWLRPQKEKQREIWGYKILFLDVLFPLSLDKVIFVDADQIVRTDMIDLVNTDLEGKAYGFTPMCDSRTEMEGFRFWKQGYWANYLRGRPYHISALYVVDLHRFRELAAGDRLRGSYHQLSADPASLSNLDQDLPNHMQVGAIPIHSLSQDWLWCETWCSDEAQSEARTIDLCNNPQTKEPKLDRARRQVPEWTVYDAEIAAVDQRRRDQRQDHAQETKEPAAAAADVDEPVLVRPGAGSDGQQKVLYGKTSANARSGSPEDATQAGKDEL